MDSDSDGESIPVGPNSRLFYGCKKRVNRSINLEDGRIDRLTGGKRKYISRNVIESGNRISRKIQREEMDGEIDGEIDRENIEELKREEEEEKRKEQERIEGIIRENKEIVDKFMEYLDNSEYKKISDLKIKVNERVYSLHKFVMFKSNMIKEMFIGNFKESNEEILELTDINQDTWELVLFILYDKFISIKDKLKTPTIEQILQLHRLSDYLMITDLKDFHEQVITRAIDSYLNNYPSKRIRSRSIRSKPSFTELIHDDNFKLVYDYLCEQYPFLHTFLSHSDYRHIFLQKSRLLELSNTDNSDLWQCLLSGHFGIKYPCSVFQLYSQIYDLLSYNEVPLDSLLIPDLTSDYPDLTPDKISSDHYSFNSDINSHNLHLS